MMSFQKHFKEVLSYFFLIHFLLISNYIYCQPSEFYSVGIGGGGGLFSPAINPENDQEYYVSCDLGALFHTTTGGDNYNIIPFTEVQSGVFGKVAFTSDENIRYVLKWDGPNYARRPAKSIDGGLSWNFVSGDSEVWEDKYFIYADYFNPDIIVWSTYSQLWISKDGGLSDNMIYNAESDAGLLLSGVYFDGDNIYFGTNDGVLISTDGGETVSNANYSGIPDDERIMGFGIGADEEMTRLFALTGGEGDVWCGNLGDAYWGAIRGIYTMENFSGEWTLNMSGVNTSNDYAVYLSMATNDPNTCYISGGMVDPYEKPFVMKTSDGGNSWSHVFKTHNNENIFTGYQGYQGDFDYWWGGFAIGFTVNPLNSQQSIITDLGFIHQTTDGGVTWHQEYLNPNDENPAGSPTPKKKSYHGIGMEQTSVWQIYFFDEDNIFGCFTDIKGVRSDDKGESWSMDYTGHDLNTLYHIAKHNTQDLWFAATSAVHDMYESTHIYDYTVSPSWKDGKVLYTFDMGETWFVLGDFGTPVVWVEVDPNNDDILYASVVSPDGDGGLWRATGVSSPDGSVSWEQLPSPDDANLGRPHNIRILNDGTIVMSWGARSDGGFLPGSGVFVSTDNGNTWENRSHDDMVYWTQDIVIDPFDESQNTWYACVWSGWGGAANDLGRLWRTTDRGLTWSALTDPYQFHRVYSVTVNPNDQETMYLSTETHGLWVTHNKSDDDPDWTLVESYPYMAPRRISFDSFNENKMWVSSFGGGMMYGDNGPSTGIDEPYLINNDNIISLFPNPANDILNIINKQDVAIRNVTFFNQYGQEVLNISKSIDQIDVSSLQNGLYFVEIKLNGQILNNKILIE